MESASLPSIASGKPPWRYGDFPELLWDLRPEELINVEHPAILGRILTSGSLDMIRALVPFDTIQNNLDRIEAPEHVRRFWSLVVQRRLTRLDGSGGEKKSWMTGIRQCRGG